MRTEFVNITPELLSLLSEIDEFKGVLRRPHGRIHSQPGSFYRRGAGAEADLGQRARSYSLDWKRAFIRG